MRVYIPLLVILTWISENFLRSIWNLSRSSPVSPDSHTAIIGIFTDAKLPKRQQCTSYNQCECLYFILSYLRVETDPRYTQLVIVQTERPLAYYQTHTRKCITRHKSHSLNHRTVGISKTSPNVHRLSPLLRSFVFALRA